jgi:putative transcriptional regulator
MPSLSDPLASRAVLIGVADYRHLPGLPAVANNVDALARLLADEAVWGLPDRRCSRIRDPASPVEVDRALREAAAGAGPDGLLFVYYAGHGLVEPASGALYLAVAGTEEEALHATAVPYDWVRHRVRQTPAARRLVVLDCCYAGRALERMGAPDRLVEEVAIDRVCVLVAAPATRAALAPAGEEFTAFTGELVAVLRQGVPDGPDLLDAETLWRTVRAALRGKGRPLPELRAHNAGGELPVARNAARPARLLAGRVLTGRDPGRAAGRRLLVLAHDPALGALGVRLDAPSRCPVRAALAEWADLAAGSALVFEGGPAERGVAIAVALLRPGAEPPPGFVPLRGRLGTLDLSADPGPARAALAGLRIFAGYHGWRAGELERELHTGRLVDAGDVPEELLDRGG